MLILPKNIEIKILRQVRKEFPNEACGILAGKGRRICKVYPMMNARHSPSEFLMKPEEQFEVSRDMRRRRFNMLGIYHSHGEGPATPSARDVREAFSPRVSCVIVSVENKVCPEIRSYIIKEGSIKQETIRLLSR